MCSDFLNSNSISHIYVLYPDLHGIVRGKLLSVDAYRSIKDTGMRNCCGVFSKDATGTPVMETEILWKNGADDNFMIPCVDTLRLAPWKSGFATVIADVYEPDGKPLLVSPRHVLKHTIEQFRAAVKAHPVVGYELEFSLLDRANQFVSQGTQAYSIHQLSRAADVLDVLADSLHASGIAIEGMVAENCDGQYEVSLRHTDALGMADNLFQTKHMIKEIAQRAGLSATFMALPDNGLAPNSLHINVSLSGGGQEFRVCPDSTLTASLASSIAGALEKSNDLLPLFLPTINAFRAPYADSFFPKSASWGFDNRSVLVRVPERLASSCRLEFRLPTADANPYLALSGMLALIARGIEKEIPLADPVTGNGFDRNDLPLLDFNFARALDRLEQQNWLYKYFDKDALDVFLVVKRSEQKKFKSYVTDWEKNTYRNLF